MNLLFLQLSDIHIAKQADGFGVNINKLVQALNIFNEVDECIIIISGDITNEGKVNEFKVAGDMLGNLVNELKRQKFKNKWINVLVVPGNHDLDLSNNNRSFEDIVTALRSKKQEGLVDNDLKSLNNFYEFARRNKCFADNKTISHQRINIDGFFINFTLINTAVFSLHGSSNQDMGIHYLSEEDIANLVPKVSSDLNISVMHHSNEWFITRVKDKLRDILGKNFSMVFEGHEHNGFGEQRKFNNETSICYVQGNSLSGDKDHPKGFVAIEYNTEEKSVKGYSFLWNNDYYKAKQILDGSLKDKCVNQFRNSKDFIKYLDYDDNNRLISQYFVFPSLTYNITNEENELETTNIQDIETFIKTINSNDKIIISGESKAGKSTLAKITYQNFINNDNSVTPLLFLSEDLQHIKIERIIDYAFKDQYLEINNAYDKFFQLEKSNRIAIIDDAGKISKVAFNKILELFDKMFNKVIIFCEDKIDLNIEKQVIEALTERKVAQINIKPFLYDKRKLLISKVYNNSNLPDVNSKQVIETLNNMINTQIRYFRLDPEFIINFVEQYTEKFKTSFTSESNIFSMVYENSIKERIIKNAQPGDVNGLFRIMGEIAAEMHFNKKTWIDIGEVIKLIEAYNKDFRQKVQISKFLECGQKSRLIIEKESKIKFKDNNLLAYFVAQGLNVRYYYEDITDKLKFLLDNLCFGINSNIILFISLITNNPKIIDVVLNCANEYFKDLKELSFDLNNIPFLCQSSFKVKNTIPDENEKQQKENEIVKYEEELKVSDLIEIIDLYDYDEKEIKTFANQIIKSVKFLEILSKILPAFSYNMKTIQQDSLVKALYSFPNCFIFQLLSDFNDNYEDHINEINKKMTEIRKEKNIAELHIERIQKLIEQMSISLVISLYQFVASIASTNQTIESLNAFNFGTNSNYSIMNLMMVEKTTNQKEFCEKAIKLYEKSDIKLIKSMVKFTVRNYFLNHDVKIVGETQALIDKFFGASDSNNNEKRMMKIGLRTTKLKKISQISHI